MRKEPRRKKRPTMQEIANLFGVSKVTVSKAINNKEGVSEDLREDIINTALTMGYPIIDRKKNPNPSQNNIILFLDQKYFDENLHGYFYVKLYQLISSHLSELGYGVSLTAVNMDGDGSESQILSQGSNVVGVIILGMLQESFLTRMQNIMLPLIFVDYYDHTSNSECVVSENIYSTYEITNHLIEMGHREIGFVGSVHVTPSIMDRYLGYQRALLEEHLPSNKEWVIPDRDKHNDAIDLKLPTTMPTAFVCNCDETAYRFVTLLKEHGYRVPEDISIVSFDNDIYAEICIPKLTTLSVNTMALARVTAQKIHRQIEKGVRQYDWVSRINGNIIYRDSVQRLSRKNR